MQTKLVDHYAVACGLGYSAAIATLLSNGFKEQTRTAAGICFGHQCCPEQIELLDSGPWRDHTRSPLRIQMKDLDGPIITVQATDPTSSSASLAALGFTKTDRGYFLPQDGRKSLAIQFSPAGGQMNDMANHLGLYFEDSATLSAFRRKVGGVTFLPCDESDAPLRLANFRDLRIEIIIGQAGLLKHKGES